MSKFDKGKKSKEAPQASTAALPDIVFMLLFFFMVVTNMKEDEPKVKTTLPSANEVVKLKNKSLVTYIYVGQPVDPKWGTSSRIQMNDDFLPVEGVREAIEKRRSEMKESDVPKMTTSLKVDKDTKMGVVTDLKQELRKSQALKVNYATVK